jgi:hypothetical protein
MDGSGERSGSAFFYDDERAVKWGTAGPIGGPLRVSHNWRPGILLQPRAGSPLGQICCRFATSSRRLIFFLGWLGRALDDSVQ